MEYESLSTHIFLYLQKKSLILFLLERSILFLF